MEKSNQQETTSYRKTWRIIGVGALALVGISVFI